MMRMREHIHRGNIGDTISREFLRLLISRLPDENFEITGERRRITGDIDDLLGTK